MDLELYGPPYKGSFPVEAQLSRFVVMHVTLSCVGGLTRRWQ